MSCVSALPMPAPDPALAVGQSVAVFRLFHALGGSAAWFRVRVAPVMAQWQTLLTGCARAPGDRAVLEWVLMRAALAAEDDPAATPRPPEQRLAAAHRAGWIATHALRTGGVPCSDSRSADPPRAGQWGDLAASLVQSGRWSVVVRPGRWRRLGAQPALLWPLAGHDLRALGAPACTLAQVIAGLAMEGYLAQGNMGSALRFGRRPDGRILTVLPVGPSLLARLAVDAGLAAAPLLEPVLQRLPAAHARCRELADV